MLKNICSLNLSISQYADTHNAWTSYLILWTQGSEVRKEIVNTSFWILLSWHPQIEWVGKTSRKLTRVDLSLIASLSGVTKNVRMSQTPKFHSCWGSSFPSICFYVPWIHTLFLVVSLMNCHDNRTVCTERCFLMGFKCRFCSWESSFLGLGPENMQSLQQPLI